MEFERKPEPICEIKNYSEKRNRFLRSKMHDTDLYKKVNASWKMSKIHITLTMVFPPKRFDDGEQLCTNTCDALDTNQVSTRIRLKVIESLLKLSISIIIHFGL